MHSKMIQRSSSGHRQRGATLIVSLVILTVVTILGLASMRNSNLELKMAASARDRGVAFQIAESALRIVESNLKRADGTAFTNNELAGKCGGSDCRNFTKTCTGGYCFTGDFDGDPQNCSLAYDGSAEQKWRTTNWDSTSTPAYSTVAIPNSAASGAANTVKYIVEFMCFIPKESKGTEGVGGTPPVMLPLFRVTVHAVGESGRSSVMLQSVFQSSEA